MTAGYVIIATVSGNVNIGPIGHVPAPHAEKNKTDNAIVAAAKKAFAFFENALAVSFDASTIFSSAADIVEVVKGAVPVELQITVMVVNIVAILNFPFLLKDLVDTARELIQKHTTKTDVYGKVYRVVTVTIVLNLIAALATVVVAKLDSCRLLNFKYMTLDKLKSIAMTAAPYLSLALRIRAFVEIYNVIKSGVILYKAHSITKGSDKWNKATTNKIRELMLENHSFIRKANADLGEKIEKSDFKKQVIELSDEQIVEFYTKMRGRVKVFAISEGMGAVGDILSGTAIILTFTGVGAIATPVLKIISATVFLGRFGYKKYQMHQIEKEELPMVAVAA